MKMKFDVLSALTNTPQTAKEIAEKLGATTTTVHKALNGSAAVIQGILQTGTRGRPAATYAKSA
jgi:response regulator of citrate/malate metabolism